jgi:hypothetical protein
VISNLLLFVSLALAQDFKNVKQGQPAPFDGTLLRPESVAKIVTYNDAEIEQCKADLKHQIEKIEINCELDTQKLEYDLSSYKMTTDALMKEKQIELDRAYDLLKKQNKNLTPLWLGIGFAGGIATSIGIIYVYNNI